jgi:hypothetical protein
MVTIILVLVQKVIQTPVKVPKWKRIIGNVTDLKIIRKHTLVLTDNKVKVLGNTNMHGELGFHQEVAKLASSIFIVPISEKIESISAKPSLSHWFASTTAGVYAIGCNDHAQLGVASLTDHYNYIHVGHDMNHRVVQIDRSAFIVHDIMPQYMSRALRNILQPVNVREFGSEEELEEEYMSDVSRKRKKYVYRQKKKARKVSKCMLDDVDISCVA